MIKEIFCAHFAKWRIFKMPTLWLEIFLSIELGKQRIRHLESELTGNTIAGLVDFTNM
jgi:hypothetical protein